MKIIEYKVCYISLTGTREWLDRTFASRAGAAYWINSWGKGFYATKENGFVGYKIVEYAREEE